MVIFPSHVLQFEVSVIEGDLILVRNINSLIIDIIRTISDIIRDRRNNHQPIDIPSLFPVSYRMVQLQQKRTELRDFRINGLSSIQEKDEEASILDLGKFF